MAIVIKDKNVQEKVQKYEEITRKVKELLIERLNLPLTPEEIADDSALFGLGLGLDSVDALEIAVGLEQEFGIKVTDEDMAVFRSVISISQYVITSQEETE